MSTSTSSYRSLLDQIRVSLEFLKGNHKKPTGYNDQFGMGIQDGTRNEADLPSHYPASPERWRFFHTDISESNRIFLQYSNDNRYAHQRFDGNGEYDVHQIMPSPGETLIFRTAERFRYKTGYEAEVTQAFSVNQSLQSGDIIQIGPFDSTDGYGIEFNGELGDNYGQIFMKRAGEKVDTKTVHLHKPITEFTRWEMAFAWYNIGAGLERQTFSSEGETLNKSLGGVSAEGGRGPRWANLPITFKITAGGSTSNLIGNIGTVGWRTLGDVNARARPKGIDFLNDNIGTIDTWVPLRAFRTRPDLDIVNNQLIDIRVLNYTADVTVRLIGLIFSPQNVTFDGSDNWSTPDIWNRRNNAIETRADINQIVDNSQTLQTTTTTPGGFLVGKDILAAAGTQSIKGFNQGGGLDYKRNIPDRDYLVILGHASSSADVHYEVTFEQDW